jgi:hypothetical protein
LLALAKLVEEGTWKEVRFNEAKTPQAAYIVHYNRQNARLKKMINDFITEDIYVYIAMQKVVI